MITILIHILLGIVLFFTINWIGKRSYSKGYIRFALLDEMDEAHSTNIVIKIFGPIIFIILIAALFQYFKLDWINEQLINVIYSYLVLRVSLIFAFERFRIANWPRIILYYSCILILSTIIFDGFIDNLDNILPDFTQLKNEIWLLVLVFLYQIGNGTNAESTSPYENYSVKVPEIIKRKKKYVLRKYKLFSDKYLTQINNVTDSDTSMNILVLSILIYENFNRPPIVRYFERIWVSFSKRAITQGVMQVASTKKISDLNSIELGARKLMNKLNQLNEKDDYPYRKYQKILKVHNADKAFIQETLFIAKIIIDNNKFDSEKISVLKSNIEEEFQLYEYE